MSTNQLSGLETVSLPATPDAVHAASQGFSPLIRTQKSRPQLWYPIGDVAGVWALTFVTLLLAGSHDLSSPRIGWASSCTALLFALVQVLACKKFGLYTERPISTLIDEVAIAFQATLLALLVTISSLYITDVHDAKTSTLLIIGVISASWVMASRKLRSLRIEENFAAGVQVRNALIIGAGDVGYALARLFRENRRLGYEFCGFLDDQVDGTEVIGSTEDLDVVIRRHFIEEIFVTIPSRRDLVKRLTMEAPKFRVNVSVVPDLFDGAGWNVPISRVGHFPTMILHREEPHAFQRFLKRVIDLAGASIGLLILFPVMLIVALLVKLDSKGPVFYRAQRVGKKGLRFECWKFRTMIVDADRRLKELAHLNEREGLLFKMANDPRVTRVGRILRRYSFDELPQLWNVLIGDMSLVGPRPPSIEEYLQYEAEHLRKLEVSPGLTGLWQVSARTDPSFESYIRYDVEYIENWSVWLDFKILLLTVRVVLQGTGV